MMLRLSCVLTVVLLCVSGTGLAGAPPAAAGFAPGPGVPLDLGRYAGRWHVLARIPHPAERGHVGSSNDYVPQGDGDMRIFYRYRERPDGPEEQLQLRASASADSGFRRWRTWHYRVLPSHSEVLEVAADYSWALVANRRRSMAWILARDPAMDTLQYRNLLERLASHGVPTDRMRRVVHQASQIGQLGYESPPSR